MKSEVASIIQRIERTLYGDPWYGKAILSILDEVDGRLAHVQKSGSPHSLLAILYHMNAWATFTLKSIRKEPFNHAKQGEDGDWPLLNVKTYTWKKELSNYKKLHKEIVTELQKLDDSFLVEMVAERKYNFRFLLNGLLEHNIYHAGQIALLSKLSAA
ncbi:MAG: hypothetical protein RIR12_982 [Bacteroidota bacterium]|jgi:uncharacterized damage-inducible protein DinB